MVIDAMTRMVTTLKGYLPASPALPIPQPNVSIVRLEERQVGLGGWRALDERRHAPVAQKGVRLDATARFQLWSDSPDAIEQQTAVVTAEVLGDKQALEADGFLELTLKAVSTAEHLAAVPSWRQTIDFDVLYEFEFEDDDNAGGLIARIPIGLQEHFGALEVTGRLVVWNGEAAPALRMSRGRLEGLTTLSAFQAAPPAGTVTLTRTVEGAAGPPAAFATLDAFLDAVAGPAPSSTHAEVAFASIGDLFAALGAAGAPIAFVDENGAPRAFEPRSLAFAQPVELPSRADRFDVAFSAPSLGPGDVMYVGGLGGSTPPA